jgi:hypothetical protein
MLAKHASPDFRAPVASAATAKRRGVGGKTVGTTVASHVRAVLCARNKAAETKARDKACAAARRVLEALEAQDVVATHMELPIFDLFSGHATGVDIVGLHRATGRLVLVELKVHACAPKQFCGSGEAGAPMMRKPLDAMEDTLLNHAVCQLLWAQSALRTQYGNPACSGLVVVVSPSGKDDAYCHHTNNDRGDARLEYWHNAVRPDLSARFSLDAKKDRTREAAKLRRGRKRRERGLETGAGAGAGAGKKRVRVRVRVHKRARKQNVL